mgnify:CR=1 FL=1
MSDGHRWRRRLAEAAALLETERRLLVRGAIAEINRLGPRRDAAAAALTEMPDAAAEDEREALASIRAAALRNARLLRAYRDGAANALNRLRALDAKAADIGAYRQDGSKMPATGGPTRERRA